MAGISVWRFVFDFSITITRLHVMSGLSNKLRVWGQENPGEQGDFAIRLAAGLEDPKQQSLWSLIDIPVELERRASQNSGFVVIAFLRRIRFLKESKGTSRIFAILESILGFVDKVLPLFYLLPIAITWFSLSEVVDSYQNVGQNLPVSERVDFLAFWSGAGREGSIYGGTPLSEVASLVFGVLLLMILFQLLTVQREAAPASSEALRSLSLEAQLTLAKSRAVTPDELTDTLSIAANQLKTALEQSTTSMQSMAGMNDKLVSVVNTLNNVSNSLSASAQKIENSVQPLAALPGELSAIFSSVSALSSGLADVQNEIQASAENLFEVAKSIQRMAQINDASNEQTSQFVTNLAKAQLIASEFVSGMEAASRTIEDLTGQLKDREPHLVQLRSITEQFNNSVRSLHNIAEEFRYSADQYKAVNEAHRSRQ